MAAPTTDRPVIEVRNLSRRFRRKTAVDDVTMSVPRGCVFGLVGENGAGKTTLIKHILGALKAQEGSVRVFDLDPVARPEKVLARIGYLSEDRDLPGWMRIGELIGYTKSFFPRWDAGFANELLETLRLDLQAKVKTLSRGERAKTGLLIALAHRPELLVLDEPSSGLDPIVRRDILGAIVRTVADEGRTVFFSSHLLDEVERVSDYVAMMCLGKLVLSGPLDEVKGNHARLTIHYEQPRDEAPRIDGALSCHGQGREWTVICNGRRDEIVEAVGRENGSVVEEQTPSLEEIFVARSKSAAQGV